jgi:hypothetical protein
MLREHQSLLSHLISELNVWHHGLRKMEVEDRGPGPLPLPPHVEHVSLAPVVHDMLSLSIPCWSISQPGERTAGCQ